MRAIGWLLNCAFVAIVLLGITAIGPEIETRWNPVYAKFKIVSVDPVGLDAVRFTVDLYKFRDCLPQGYGWYSGDLGSYNRQLNVVAQSQNTAPKLPVGKSRSVFVVHGITLREVPGIWAETYSRCHPFWMTRSVVFP